MIFTTRPTIEVQNLLSEPSLGHGVSFLGKASIGLVSLRRDEAPSSPRASARWYSLLEDVGVFTVVEPIGKLIQVKREILPANIMVCPDDTPLEQTPKRINIVCVYFPMHIFARGMVYFLVAIPESTEVVIALPFIRGYQIHLVAYRLSHKLIQSLFRSAFDDSTYHVALAGDRPNNSSLSAAASDVALLIPMTVLVLAADKGFIYFHDTHKFLEIGILQPGPKPMAHVPRGLMRSANLPGDLESTDTLLAIEHLPEHFKPRLEVNVCVLEDGADCDGEAIGRSLGWRARLANPMPRTRFELINLGVFTARALNTFRPAAFHQELLAGIIVREGFHELFECHHA